MFDNCMWWTREEEIKKLLDSDMANTETESELRNEDHLVWKNFQRMVISQFEELPERVFHLVEKERFWLRVCITY